MYPEGNYRVRIMHQQVTVSSKGNPQLLLKIKPLSKDDEPESAESDFPFERSVYLTLTPATLGTAEQPGWVAQVLKELGFAGLLSQLDPNSPEHVSLVSRETNARNVHETYNDQPKERWNFQSERAAAKSADRSQLQSLDERFGSVFAAVQPVARPIRGPVQDDIPF